MNFEFEYQDYQKFIKYLKEPEFSKFNAFMEKQKQDAIIKHMNPDYKSNSPVGNLHILEDIIFYQFINPLIETLEDSDKVDKTKGDFASELKELKNLRTKLLNALQVQKTKLPFNILKGNVSAKVGLTGDSFEYETPLELQRIVEQMCETYLDKDAEFIFSITPPYSPYASSSYEDTKKSSIDSVLSAAAKQGIRPDQVKIYINNTLVVPEKDATFQEWEKQAAENFELKQRLTRPRI